MFLPLCLIYKFSCFGTYKLQWTCVVVVYGCIIFNIVFFIIREISKLCNSKYLYWFSRVEIQSEFISRCKPVVSCQYLFNSVLYSISIQNRPCYKTFLCIPHHHNNYISFTWKKELYWCSNMNRVLRMSYLNLHC